MKRKIIIAAALVCLFVIATSASAVSLWDDNRSWFTDRKAAAIGDIVMVRIVEHLNDKDEGKATSNKASNNNIGNGFGILDFIRSFGLSATNSTTGNTKLERKKDLTGTVSCLVTDIMPNGNFVIEGNRILVEGDEKMRVTFSGVVRPIDIAADNVVRSDRVANAEIFVTGKGSVSRTQRPGIISQVLSALF